MATRPAAAVLDESGTTILSQGSVLMLLTSDAQPATIAEGLNGIDFLCASPTPTGKHFAYWSRGEERFFLRTTDGALVHSHRISTDKASPLGIHFATSGDSVAFLDDYDGGFRVHFYQIEKKYWTEFGPSWHPIGFDPSLRRFFEVPVRYVTHGISSYPVDDCKGQVPILDRHRSVRGYVNWMPKSGSS